MSFYLMHRGWMDNPAFKREAFTDAQAWIWLIEQASYQPHYTRYGNKIIEVGRGEIPTSYRQLKEAFRWGNQRVAAYLAILEQQGMLERKTGTGFLVITICNYGKYQSALRNSGTRTGTLSGTLSGTQPGTNIKNTNELKERKDPLGFDIFFEKFPKQRKGGRRNALTAWNAALKIATAEEIHRGLEAYIGSDEVRVGRAKGAAAWLNDERWTVDYSFKQTAPLSAAERDREARKGALTIC